jgi:hypothetical protein
MIKLDKTAPDTTANLSGTAGNDGWYRSNVTVAFTVIDEASGLLVTECRINEPNSLGYCTGGYTQTQDGSYTLYYRSKDKAGLVEGLKQISFRLDKTAPESAVTLTGTQGLNGWYTSNVVAAIAASDGVSGVFRTEFSMDNGASWNSYSTAITLSAEGTTTILYRSVDVAGNVEAAKTLTVNIDRTPPSVTATSPLRDAKGVALAQTITVSFSEAVFAGPAYAGITIMSGKSGIASTVSAAGSVLTLDPAANLPKNSTITVTVPAGAVMDAAGNPLAAPYSFSFKTGK